MQCTLKISIGSLKEKTKVDNINPFSPEFKSPFAPSTIYVPKKPSISTTQELGTGQQQPETGQQQQQTETRQQSSIFKIFVPIEHGTHNDTNDGPVYHGQIRAFLTKVIKK